MVEVRPYRDEDRDALLSFMRASFENEVDEAHCESLISDSAGIWLATASEGTALAGFCRLVPDEETRARRRACMDILSIGEGSDRIAVGGALIAAVRGVAAGAGLSLVANADIVVILGADGVIYSG